MTSKITIQATPRILLGRASKQVRAAGAIPAVVYGHGFAPVSIQVNGKEFTKVFAEAGETTLVYLALDGTSYPTIIHDVAKDAATDALLHVDFYKVKLDEKIHAKIPVEIVGVAPAVKDFGGSLLKNISEIEVEGFPQDLPHQFAIDISSLAAIGNQITVKDVVMSDKLTLKADPNDIVVLIQAPISEEQLKKELETSTASADDVKVIEKEKAADEEGADTAAAPAESPKAETKK